MRLARKYACRYRATPGSGLSHTSGHGAPSRKKCAYCGGPLDVETGLWGVFTWTGTGRYPKSAAVKIYSNVSLADGYAMDNRSNLVVRWIPEAAS